MDRITIMLASQGHNQALANQVSNQLKTNDVHVSTIDLVDLNLPLYSTKAQHDDGVPKSVNKLYEACVASDGFVFVSPEYNGGIPPVLTNAIAWVSVSSQTWREAFNTKLAGIATFSGGGGMQLIMNLRGQLAYLGLTVIGLPLHTNHQKPLVTDDLVAFSAQLSKGISG